MITRMKMKRVSQHSGGLREGCPPKKFQVKDPFKICIQPPLTLENFAKLLEMDQSGLTSTLLKRCKMSCGDFVELTKAYEKTVLKGKSHAK